MDEQKKTEIEEAASALMANAEEKNEKTAYKSVNEQKPKINKEDVDNKIFKK